MARAVTVSVELTKRDVQILRALIADQHKRLAAEGDRPGTALNVIARKVWLARQQIELTRITSELCDDAPGA